MLLRTVILLKKVVGGPWLLIKATLSLWIIQMEATEQFFSVVLFLTCVGSTAFKLAFVDSHHLEESYSKISKQYSVPVVLCIITLSTSSNLEFYGSCF